MGISNNVVPVPVAPPSNSEVVVVVPPVDGARLVILPNILLPLPNGAGTGVDDFPPNKPPEVAAEVGPPSRPLPGADVVLVVPGVGVVKVASKSVPPGLEPKMFPGAVVVVPPVPVAGVEVCVVLV